MYALSIGLFNQDWLLSSLILYHGYSCHGNDLIEKLYINKRTFCDKNVGYQTMAFYCPLSFGLICYESTETVFDPEFATNISFLPESYTTPAGVPPTGTVEETVFVVSFIMETLFEPEFATNISPLAES